MPGTLLLKDLERSNQDELGEHVRSMYGAPSAPPVAPPSTIQTPPPDTMQELGGHLQSLLSGGLNTIGEGLSNVSQGAQNVPQELQTHVQNLLTAPPPAPEPTLTPATPVGETTPPQPGPQGSLQDAARAAATAVGVDPEVFARQIQQESGYRTDAASPAGARGVAQFMPGTGASVAKQMGVSEADFWADPGLQLRGAATHMRDLLGQFGGDYAKALAAYNAGPGNVQKYGGIPPFEETQRYVKTILGGAGEAVKPFVEGAQAAARAVTGESRGDISQFGDAQLTAAEASAACGPAAAVRFAQRFGRNPTLREATNLATEVGWTQNQGMAGIGSEQKLLSRMGVETKLIPGADWGTFANEASTGNPVVISTRGHYFYADNWDRESNRFHVGRSGMDLKGGSEWMTPEQMTGLMGEVQGGLLANNPVTPASTTTRGFASPTAAGAPMAPTAPEPEQEQGLTILDDAIDRTVKAPEQRAASVPERQPTELIAPPESPQSRLAAQSGDVAGLSGAGAFQSPAVEGEQSGLERFGRAILQSPLTPWGAADTLGRVGGAIKPGLEGLSEAVGPALGEARENIANAPVLGGALGLARGPMLLEDQELIKQATPAQLETARKYASLVNPNPTEQDVADTLRGFQIGEAYAIESATGGMGKGAKVASKLSRAIDYDALARMRRAAERVVPEPGATAAREPNLADRVISFTVNNVLANPASLLANAAGGLMETVKRPTVTAATAGVEALTGNLAGAKTQLGAAGADLRAMGLAIADVLGNSATAFTTGRRVSRAADQPEAFEGAAGMIATPFLRGMGATDEAVNTLNSAGAQASKLVELMRANPKLSQAEVMAQFQDELLAAGRAGGAEAIFQTGGTGIGESIARARAKLTDPDATVGERIKGGAAAVLVPFSSVPDVLLTRGAKRIPGINEFITAPIEAAQAMRRGDPTAAKRAGASAALATATNFAIWSQVQEGKITGSGPDDPAKKRALMQARDENGNPLWRPNSIRVGDQWVPYSSLGGVAVQIGAIANAVEQYEYAGKQVNPDMAKAFGTALGETIMDAWYLQTVSGVFSAIQNGKLPEWMGTQALSTAGRVIPEAAALNVVKKLTDPTAREAEPKLADPATWLEYFAARLPVASQTVKPRLDPATGRPIEEPQTIASALTRGTAPGEPNPVNEELARHNLGAPDPPTTITTRSGATIALTEPEQRRFLELAGPEIEQLVLEMSRDPDYQQATPDVQRTLLQRMIGAGRRIATATMFENLPEDELLRRIEQSREAERRQAEPSVRLP
jgi:hypothetical protein